MNKQQRERLAYKIIKNDRRMKRNRQKGEENEKKAKQ